MPVSPTMRRNRRDQNKLQALRQGQKNIGIYVWLRMILVAILKLRVCMYVAAKLFIYISYYSLTLKTFLVYLVNVFIFEQPIIFECMWLLSNVSTMELVNTRNRKSIEDLKKYPKVIIITGLIPLFAIHGFYLRLDSLLKITTLEVGDLFDAVYYCYISGAIIADLLVIHFVKTLIKLNQQHTRQYFFD